MDIREEIQTHYDFVRLASEPLEAYQAKPREAGKLSHVLKLADERNAPEQEALLDGEERLLRRMEVAAREIDLKFTPFLVDMPSRETSQGRRWLVMEAVAGEWVEATRPAASRWQREVWALAIGYQYAQMLHIAHTVAGLSGLNHSLADLRWDEATRHLWVVGWHDGQDGKNGRIADLHNLGKMLYTLLLEQPPPPQPGLLAAHPAWQNLTIGTRLIVRRFLGNEPPATRPLQQLLADHINRFTQQEKDVLASARASLREHSLPPEAWQSRWLDLDVLIKQGAASPETNQLFEEIYNRWRQSLQAESYQTLVEQGQYKPALAYLQIVLDETELAFEERLQLRRWWLLAHFGERYVRQARATLPGSSDYVRAVRLLENRLYRQAQEASADGFRKWEPSFANEFREALDALDKDIVLHLEWQKAEEFETRADYKAAAETYEKIRRDLQSFPIMEYQVDIQGTMGDLLQKSQRCWQYVADDEELVRLQRLAEEQLGRLKFTAAYHYLLRAQKIEEESGRQKRMVPSGRADYLARLSHLAVNCQQVQQAMFSDAEIALSGLEAADAVLAEQAKALRWLRPDQEENFSWLDSVHQWVESICLDLSKRLVKELKQDEKGWWQQWSPPSQAKKDALAAWLRREPEVLAACLWRSWREARIAKWLDQHLATDMAIKELLTVTVYEMVTVWQILFQAIQPTAPQQLALLKESINCRWETSALYLKDVDDLQKGVKVAWEEAGSPTRPDPPAQVERRIEAPKVILPFQERLKLLVIEARTAVYQAQTEAEKSAHREVAQLLIQAMKQLPDLPLVEKAYFDEMFL